MILKCSAGHITDTSRGSLSGPDPQFKKPGDRCGQLISYDVMQGSRYCQRILKDADNPNGVTIKGKVEYWIKQQNPGKVFDAPTLHWDLFRYQCQRATINAALRDFAANGLIGRAGARGRTKKWKVLPRKY